jgi:predicted PhzF superfamily epimerase YddE/YHI9
MSMKTLPIYQVDAFTTKLFGGNPAAVVPLERWLPDAVMQNIAMENNLAETAFIVREAEGYRIRWFTPAIEVDLCGHATLAGAFVYFTELGHNADSISFSSRSGMLTVTRKGNELTLDFPRDEVTEIPLSADITSCFTEKPIAAFKGKTDYMVVFGSESEIATMVPDTGKINSLVARGVIVTAKGNEAPVTGSAHTTLTPYWSERLGKKTMKAIQLSARRGYLSCTSSGERVLISGEARTFLKGEMTIE